MAVDALGLPVRFVTTPGHWGDSPQAKGLIEGLSGVAHVIADAAYDADHLRKFITENMGATARIKPNPSRSAQPDTDWALFEERHLVECFLNKIKRFRRIALRCEKTVRSFKAVADLASLWLGSNKRRRHRGRMDAAIVKIRRISKPGHH